MAALRTTSAGNASVSSKLAARPAGSRSRRTRAPARPARARPAGRCGHASSRAPTITTSVPSSTTSSRWFRVSTRSVTIPRSGLERDRRTSSILGHGVDLVARQHGLDESARLLEVGADRPVVFLGPEPARDRQHEQPVRDATGEPGPPRVLVVGVQRVAVARQVDRTHRCRRRSRHGARSRPSDPRPGPPGRSSRRHLPHRRDASRVLGHGEQRRRARLGVRLHALAHAPDGTDQRQRIDQRVADTAAVASAIRRSSAASWIRSTSASNP